MVKIAVAEARPMAERLEVTGVVEPTRVAKMGSPAEGPIVACPVREGDRVRTGQLLARLGRVRGDDAAAAAARVQLDREEVDLGRVERLVATGAIPGEELDAARVKVSEARARLATAAEKLGDYRVVAPWDGVISKVHVAVGDFVSARDDLIELFDPDSLVLRAAVPESSSVLVSEATTLEVRLDAYPGRSFEGRVTRIYPEIDRRTFTRTIEVELAGELHLVPGMFARLELTLSSVPEAIVVPVEAILHQEGAEPAVFVISTLGKAAHRQVKTGIEESGWVQITEGLEPGEKVAVAGHGRLRDGAKVRIVGSKTGKGPGTVGTKGEAGKVKSGSDR
jgi:membrane fusion protein (multidrug efflux system)